MSQPIFRKYYSNLNDGFWRFSSPTQVLSCHSIQDARLYLDQLLNAYGDVKIGIVTDETIQTLPFYHDLLCGRIYDMALVKAECEVKAIARTVDQFRACDVGLIVAIGGGSVLDAAKLISASVTNSPCLDELILLDELKFNPVPLISIPTTYGTGAEVNVIGHLKIDGEKMSFRRDWLAPAFALLITDVAISCPNPLRYLSALDAWLHAFEALTLKSENSPLQFSLVKGAMDIHKSHFKNYVLSPDENSAGQIVAASNLGGVILNNSRTGLIHALATPFAEKYGFPHSESLLPFIKPVIEYNWPVIQSQYPEYNLGGFNEYIEKQYLFFAKDIVSQWGLTVKSSDIDEMATTCLKDTVLMKENPVALNVEGYKQLYLTSLDKWLS